MDEIENGVPNGTTRNGVKVGGTFNFECLDKNGKLKWEFSVENLVVNEGLEHLLDVLFIGDTQVNPWYVGLLGSTPSLEATDGLTDLTEFTSYDGNRKEYVDVRSSQTVSNTASQASFSINGSGTVGGAFLASVATGTAGTLLCGAARSGGDRSVESGDTVNVTYTFSADDDGE